ncbi:MAG: DUF1611 domain-containing protein [Geminicoccaceae bacterium]
MELSIVRNNEVVPADAKWAFTTRRVDRKDVRGMSPEIGHAVPGDLVLGRIAFLGQHKKVQLTSGRSSESYLGDHVVMVVGNRYAPDQFEGIAELDPEGCDMIAGGGVLGRMVHAYEAMDAPTRVVSLGLLTDADGEVLNVASYALPDRTIPAHVTVIGVFGASMNAGKTTAAASLAHGLKRAGHTVACVKATGTGAFGDYNAYRDAGVPVFDFTDAGMGTTYKMPMDRIEAGFETLVGTAAHQGADVVVVEIADGVFQQETAAILDRSRIKDRMNAIFFAAPDALGAVGGVNTLRRHGLEPFAISGKVTMSPLAWQEAERATGVPLISRDGLCDPLRVSEAVVGFLGSESAALSAETTEFVEAA